MSPSREPSPVRMTSAQFLRLTACFLVGLVIFNTALGMGLWGKRPLDAFLKAASGIIAGLAAWWFCFRMSGRNYGTTGTPLISGPCISTMNFPENTFLQPLLFSLIVYLPLAGLTGSCSTE